MDVRSVSPARSLLASAPDDGDELGEITESASGLWDTALDVVVPRVAEMDGGVAAITRW